MIRENIQSIRTKIREAAIRSGRNPDTVQLVAVSKKVSVDGIEQAIKSGQTVFGENYIQEAEVKIRQLPNPATFHFIGHLQSNKAKNAAELFDVIETIDTLKTAQTLDKYLHQKNKTMRVLVQVNIGEEVQKSGVLPAEARELLVNISKLTNIKAVGLMTIPPVVECPEDSRKYFRQLKELADAFASEGLFYPGEKIEISMGMSDDYQVAIEEGATLVRVGTAIFGARK